MSRHIIESEVVFNGVIFDIQRDKLREPHGVEIVREVVTHPGGAGGLPVFDDGRVALVRQYRHPAKQELLEIPAGKLEPGEVPEECAAREIEQEIGWRPGKMQKLAEFYSTPGFCGEKLHVYLATELTQSAQALDHDEFVEIVYLPLGEAIEMALRDELADSKTIIALLLAERVWHRKKL